MKSWFGKKVIALVIRILNNVPEHEKAALYKRYREAFFGERYNQYRKKYNLDETFRFNGEDILMYGNGRIYIAARSYIGNYSTLQASEEYHIRIGKNCSISHNVRMYTATNLADQNFASDEVKIKKYGSIEIGDGVWIGANVFINPGVKIGDNAVVGANSVVSGDIEPHAIYGGVPARLIRYKKITDEKSTHNRS